MILEPFDYYAPKTVGEALELLAQYPSDSKLLAGGQSMVPLMNLGLASPKQLIDLKRIERSELSYIVEEKDEIRIGALTTHYELSTSPIIRKHCPILAEAAGSIGDVQVRNRGTVGGSVCHSDPSADYPPVLIALGARFRAASKGGDRTINAADFFLDAFTTALEHGELVTEVAVPKVLGKPGTGGSFLKFCYVEGAFSIVNAAAVISIDEKSGKCKWARVIIGGVQTAPIVLGEMDHLIVGKPVDEGVLEGVGSTARRAVTSPLSDIHADGEYRTELGTVFAKRALAEAYEWASGRRRRRE